MYRTADEALEGWWSSSALTTFLISKYVSRRSLRLPFIPTPLPPRLSPVPSRLSFLFASPLRLSPLASFPPLSSLLSSFYLSLSLPSCPSSSFQLDSPLPQPIPLLPSSSPLPSPPLPPPAISLPPIPLSPSYLRPVPSIL